MRQHTPYPQSEGRPLPYFPAAGERPAEADSIDVDLNDLREPTPAFLLLEYRRRSSVELGADPQAGVAMDEAFEEAELALPDEPPAARSLAGQLVFGVVFGGILALLGYEIIALASESFRPLLQEFRRL